MSKERRKRRRWISFSCVTAMRTVGSFERAMTIKNGKDEVGSGIA